jgi:alpha-tubulin suppressor-like RCC1 family protein
MPTGETLRAPQRYWGDRKWAAIEGGYLTLCGITVERDGYCWGNNYAGAVGNGTAKRDTQIVTPAKLPGGFRWDEIVNSAGWSCGATVQRLATYCWGAQDDFGPGRAPISASKDVLTLVSNGAGLADLTSSHEQVCARKESAVWYCFGNVDGSFWSTPGSITGTVPLQSVHAIGNGRTCMITVGYDAYCFGRNDFGELASGSRGQQSIRLGNPSRIGTGIRWGKFFRSFTEHFCGIDLSNIGYCWGRNTSGQVGDGSTNDQTVPIQLPYRWKGLAPGLGPWGAGNRDFTCGLSTGGDVYCWGDNSYGQLGNGNTTSSRVPIKVSVPY